MKKQKDIKLLVYGTLKRGNGNYNAYLKDNANFLGTLIVQNSLLVDMGGGGFPGAVMEEGFKTNVEVFEVDAGTLGEIDGLEGHPDWYKREIVKTATYGDCYMYFQPPEILDRITSWYPDGVWLPRSLRQVWVPWKGLDDAKRLMALRYPRNLMSPPRSLPALTGPITPPTPELPLVVGPGWEQI